MAISQENLLAWPVCFQMSITFIDVHVNVCLLLNWILGKKMRCGKEKREFDVMGQTTEISLMALVCPYISE